MNDIPVTSPLASVVPESTTRLSAFKILTGASSTPFVSAVTETSNARRRVNCDPPAVDTFDSVMSPSRYSICAEPLMVTSSVFPTMVVSDMNRVPDPSCVIPTVLLFNVNPSNSQSPSFVSRTFRPQYPAFWMVPVKSRVMVLDRTTPSCDWLSRSTLVRVNLPCAALPIRTP